MSEVSRNDHEATRCFPDPESFFNYAEQITKAEQCGSRVMAKQKTGDLVRFTVLDAITGAVVRDGSGKPLRIAAYTAKAARHQAKQVHRGPVIVEPYVAAKVTLTNTQGVKS